MRSFRPARPAAPFDRDLSEAIAGAFDRETGKQIPQEALKSYRQVLAQFHLHPESKFLNGNFRDAGTTGRRHVRVSSVRNIGKEADHWEEQFYVGADEKAAVEYGLSPEGKDRLLAELRRETGRTGQRKFAKRMGISRMTLARALVGRRLTAMTRRKLQQFFTGPLRAEQPPKRFKPK